jgi:WhiB family redox-sensing transcriptional regulator
MTSPAPLKPAGATGPMRELQVLIDVRDMAWADRGLCAEVDPDEWFPDKGESSLRAKAICRSCPVRAECLEYALDHQIEHGIWGGLVRDERRRLRPPGRRDSGLCGNGRHVRTDANTRTDRSGGRHCKDCEREYDAARPPRKAA